MTDFCDTLFAALETLFHIVYYVYGTNCTVLFYSRKNNGKVGNLCAFKSLLEIEFQSDTCGQEDL